MVRKIDARFLDPIKKLIRAYKRRDRILPGCPLCPAAIKVSGIMEDLDFNKHCKVCPHYTHPVIPFETMGYELNVSKVGPCIRLRDYESDMYDNRRYVSYGVMRSNVHLDEWKGSRTARRLAIKRLEYWKSLIEEEKP